jgi:hypothetical protein
MTVNYSTTQNATFNVGSTVQKDGTYVCVPCGAKKKFKKGQVFTRCFSCMKKEKYDGDSYFKDLGLWELIS